MPKAGTSALHKLLTQHPLIDQFGYTKELCPEGPPPSCNGITDFFSRWRRHHGSNSNSNPGPRTLLVNSCLRNALENEQYLRCVCGFSPH